MDEQEQRSTGRATLHAGIRSGRALLGRLGLPLFMAAIVAVSAVGGQPDTTSVPGQAGGPAPDLLPSTAELASSSGLDALVGLAAPDDGSTPVETALPVLGDLAEGATLSMIQPAVDDDTGLDRSVAQVATANVESGTVEIWELPDASVDPLWSLGVPTEFGGPRHFAVLGRYGDWYRIQVPVRPNGTTGWIPAADVTVHDVTTSVEVDLSDRRVVVRDGTEVVFDVVGTVGAASTPTPVGRYYIRDEFPWYADSVYGPWVLALSAYSEAIDQINGGAAVIALHGTVRPDLVGQAASLGCVRLPNDLITALAELVEVGTPVHIVE